MIQANVSVALFAVGLAAILRTIVQVGLKHPSLIPWSAGLDLGGGG